MRTRALLVLARLEEDRQNQACCAGSPAAKDDVFRSFQLSLLMLFQRYVQKYLSTIRRILRLSAEQDPITPTTPR